MYKNPIIILILTIIFLSCTGKGKIPTDPKQRGVYFAAKSYEYLFGRQIDKYLELQDDEYIRITGQNKEVLKKELEESFKVMMDQEKNTYKNESVDTIKFINCKTEIQGVFKINNSMKLNGTGKDISMSTYLFGYSRDEGETWKYFQISELKDSLIDVYHKNDCRFFD